jgi:hypothetical protein
VPGDPEEAKKYNAKCRQDFLEAGFGAQQFFFKEELFIPQDIAEAVREILKFPAREPVFYRSFHGHYEASIAMKYREQVASDLSEFQIGLEKVKAMMRARIAGPNSAVLYRGRLPAVFDVNFGVSWFFNLRQFVSTAGILE